MPNNHGESRFTLILEGENLPVERINEVLGLQATRIIRKGDVMNRLPLMVAENDEWNLTIDLSNYQGTDTALNDLLAQIILHNAAVKAFEAEGIRVKMHLYVQSDYAHISYRLMPETLSRLVATGLPLDISSMSWGELGI